MKKNLHNATLDQFFYWIEERHNIYLRKTRSDERPWTDDKVMQEWKFTNVFRELDRGTVALRTMLDGRKDALALWNVIWYRLFNVDTHAVDPGFCRDPDELLRGLLNKRGRGERCFTNAHMTAGIWPDKLRGTVGLCKDIFESHKLLWEHCQRDRTQESVFGWLKQFQGIGPFLAYEITTDLRWYSGLDRDKLTWANVGPGARRGMNRLGLSPTLESMRHLYTGALTRLPFLILHGRHPFELREIEHSLCEFDKWCRVTFGEGKPRMRYQP